ncbi:unnamed protein product [Oncorhynchus mykiss]|uniref:Uncharacterized protein n=1 Tax=Oncorhynchus mykiss TaxID=8022 RepID=A0A060XZD8_ONCMY|nr:unnamed protein product [Oncorhynchus mykiss]
MPPPNSFPVGLISIITDRWRMSLRKRVRDGVAIVVKGVQSFHKQRGFIPEGHNDCHSPVRASSNDTLFRHMLNVTWEHNDFSFNPEGYLINPAMVIITLDRERQWDKVRHYTSLYSSQSVKLGIVFVLSDYKLIRLYNLLITKRKNSKKCY